MPVPKRKRSRARRDKRFANKGIKVKEVTSCNNCNEPLIPHAACKGCGYYKGVKVVRTKADRHDSREIVKQVKVGSSQSSIETHASEAASNNE